MRDNHIIRVIIQGYDRLSNVMRDAAGRTTPALDRLREKTRQYRQESDRAGSSLNTTATAISDLNKGLDGQLSKVERLNNSWGRLRRTIGQRLTGAAPTDTDEKRLFEGLPFDEIFKGIQAGRRFQLDEPDTGGALAAQREANKKELAAFDSRLAEEEKRLREQRNREKQAFKEDLKERERLTRSNLDRLEAMRDAFVLNQELALKKFKIDAKALEGDLTAADKRIRDSRSKKVSDEEREGARTRIAEVQKEIADTIAEEERAVARVITTRKQRFEILHRERLAAINEERSTELNNIEEAHKERLRTFREEQSEKRRGLVAEHRARLANVPNLVRTEIERRDIAISKLPTRVEQFTARATVGLRDLGRGFRGARDGMREFTGDALRMQTTMAQVGAEVGKATKSISNFINVRWALIISLVGIFGTVLVNLGAALVAVASSAVMAAAALGGAFVAGLAQAIPVIGLLGAAINRLGDAMDVLNQREQARERSAEDELAQARARRNAAQQLADANYALKQSLEGVADAQEGIRDANTAVTKAEKEQREAVADLARARREAARAIVDAALEEREARLGVQEAELGVLDAKQRLADFEDRRRRQGSDLEEAQAALKEAQDRLALAQQQGDAVEIATASVAVAAARGNVSSVQDQISETQNQQKELELGVQRAEINERQAQLRRQRAIEENRRRRTQGVEGSPEVQAAVERITAANESYRDAIDGVTDAQRRLRDAQHQVVIAHRNIEDAQLAVTDAANKMSAAQRKAKEEFDKLSPAEQRFVLAMERFKANVRKNLNPITNIIIDSFSRALNRVGILLADPEIKKALRGLATEIADVIDRFSKWAISPEGRRDILFFINEAKRNLPIIADAAGKFGTTLINIAKAASPLFRDIVDGFDEVGDKAKKGSENTSKLERFFESAGKHLKGWVDLAGAVGRLLGALVGAAAGEGLKMVGGMAGAFNDLADRINKNPKPIRDFFKRVREGIRELAPILGRFALVLLKVFTSENLRKFTEFVLLTVIPAILRLMEVLGFIAGVFSRILDVPIAGEMAKMVLQALLFWGALTKIFPPLRALNPLLKAAFLTPLKNLALWIIRLPLIAGLIKLVGLALRAAFITSPVGLIITGLILLIVALDRKFHFLRPTVEFLGRVFEKVFNWIKDHWKLILGIVLGPFTLIALAVSKWRGKIIGFFRAVIDWVRDHWKTIATILIAIFVPGGIIVLAIIKFRDRIIGFFKAIIDWVRNNWKKIVGLVLNIFAPGGLILAGVRVFKDKILGVFGNIKTGIINAFKGAFAWVREKFTGFADWFVDKAKKIPVVGKFFGGGDDNKLQVNPTNILNRVEDQRARRVIRRLRGKNVPDKFILEALMKIPQYKDEIMDIGKELTKEMLGFARGGMVPGQDGEAVPITAHAGEWVLNKAQQQKLARRIGESTDAIKLFLFGGGGKSPAQSAANGRPTRPAGKSTTFNNGIELIPHEDEFGITLWWLKLQSGEYAQVSSRAAKRIQASGGTWFPGYVHRKGGPALNKFKNVQGRNMVSFASPSVRSFAAGGVVGGGPVVNSPSQGGNTVNQDFQVKVEGDTDWHHVFRLGAQHAQGAY